jgi:hypothetical protein
MCRTPKTLWIGVVVLSVAAAASAQSLEQRIENLKRIHRAQTIADNQTFGDQRTIEFRMRDIINPVVIEDVSAKRVFEWWSLTTGVPLIVNWNALELEGVDPDRAINLHLSNVPAGQLLALIMHMAAPDTTLLYETSPWYVQVMTRQQALRRTVVRIYSIEDLLMPIPSFVNAPEFDLNQALSNTNSGGSSSAQGVAKVSTNIFDKNITNEEPPKSKEQQGNDLAQLISETIEPDIWQSNGGQYASIKYFNGRLIVNAPLFVHAQIGMPTAGGTGGNVYISQPATLRDGTPIVPGRAGVLGIDGTSRPRPAAGIGVR